MHLINQLKAEIEEELPRGVCSTLDRPEAAKWRQAEQPLGSRTPLRGLIPRMPPNASKPTQNGRFRLCFGCLEAATFDKARVRNNRRPDLQWRGRHGSWRASNYPIR